MSVNKKSNTQPKAHVLVVHGLGKPHQEYHLPLKKRIERYRPDLAKQLQWHSFTWYDLIAKREERMWKRLLKNPLKQHTLRRYTLSVLATATSYNTHNPKTHGLYNSIQQRLMNLLKDIEEQHGEVPLFLIGHSFGVLIICNYLWDWQNFTRRGMTASPFARLETVAGYASLGSPLPMFQLSSRRPESIRFPHPRIQNWFAPQNDWEQIRTLVRWDNYYAPDDVLGYPLKTLSHSYNENVRNDIPVVAGGWFSFWNPLSHLEYWKSKNAAHGIAEQFGNALDAMTDPSESIQKTS